MAPLYVLIPQFLIFKVAMLIDFIDFIDPILQAATYALLLLPAVHKIPP